MARPLSGGTADGFSRPATLTLDPLPNKTRSDDPGHVIWRNIPLGDIDLAEIAGANSGADHVRYQGYRVDLRRPWSNVELSLYLDRRPELDSTVCGRSAFTAATHKPPRSLLPTV